jgi:hypothetical protein
VRERKRERERGGGEIEKVREQYKNYASRKGDWLITYMRAARGGGEVAEEIVIILLVCLPSREGKNIYTLRPLSHE